MYTMERPRRYQGKRRGKGSFVLRVVVAVLAVLLALCLTAIVLLEDYIQQSGRLPPPASSVAPNAWHTEKPGR